MSAKPKNIRGDAQSELERSPMLLSGAPDSSTDPGYPIPASGFSESRPKSTANLQGSGALQLDSPGLKSGKSKTKKSKKGRTGSVSGDIPPTGFSGGGAAIPSGLIISGATGWDADGLLEGAGDEQGALQGPGHQGPGQPPRLSKSGKVWKYIMYCLVIGPWKFVRGLGWCLNRWQRVCQAISAAVFHVSDSMDKHMPTVHGFLVWLWNQISLLLHFLSVILTFVVAHSLYGSKHVGYAQIIVLLYICSHYLMGVIMYMEMDRITRAGRYSFPELVTFFQRVMEALFWDLQLLVSLVHSNCMLEGLTQMLLKGFEEARVCIHLVVNTIPLCIMLGVVYDGVAASWISVDDLDDLQKLRYEEKIWLALCVSVLNAIEKWIRLTLADPWLHPDLDDCFPLAYMRSNAARLPRGLMLEWLFRCNLQLTQQEDELVLRTLFSAYTFNCKGEARELCDGHKAYLLRKALRTFNGSGKLHRAEVIAQRLDKTKFRNPRTIRALDASNIHPGRYMSAMLADVLGESIGYSALNLANNQLGSKAIAELVDGLRGNKVLQLRVLILDNNNIGDEACDAIAHLVGESQSLSQLMMAGNPVKEAGVKLLCQALSANRSLVKLDLSDIEVTGADSGSVLASMLKTNTTLKELCMKGTRLGGSGVEALAKGLRVNTGLQTLDLSGSGADDKAAMAIAQALSTNKTLMHLNLSYTLVTDEGAKALCDAMQYNTTLQVCELNGTQADKSWMKLMHNIVSGRDKGSSKVF